MNVADFLVDVLIKKNVKDVFGIPGGVVLEFLYAMRRRKSEITTHLSFHEQCSVFSAFGYARATNGLGAAYATRGPGITNMVTGVADSYCDSIPVIIITGHSDIAPVNGMRVAADQEIDTVGMFSGITKYCVRIDDAKDIRYELERACFEAMNGRKGPVLLDIHSKVLSEQVEVSKLRRFKVQKQKKLSPSIAKKTIVTEILNSKRPLFLIGDGLRGSLAINQLGQIAEQNNIPILSSRFSQDLLPKSTKHFGYIGSHGLRYSNFILSKSDLIITLGNRMSFPVNSESWAKVFNKTRILRVDIDESELTRKIPGSASFAMDFNQLLSELEGVHMPYDDDNSWLKTCSIIKKELLMEDFGYPITAISEILKSIPADQTIVSDVGNHEYWLCRAYALGCSNSAIYSKSFGAMASSIGKAIGIHHGTGKPVTCFVGDQGLQMNIQELQYVASQQLPITIVLLNNYSSGMIRSREKQRYGEDFIHTTLESGYSVPDFCSLAEGYGIKSYTVDQSNFIKIHSILSKPPHTRMIEIRVDPSIEMIPYTPRGNPFQKMSPELDDDKFMLLDKI
jgi:acetolactate synthase I/II/III large subunit